MAVCMPVQQSDIRWASRWDTYLLMTDDQIHWFSIINSLMIVLFLSGMVAMIMMRTLHRDISKYNQLETAEEAQEETGWKLVRQPAHFFGTSPEQDDLLRFAMEIFHLEQLQGGRRYWHERGQTSARLEACFQGMTMPSVW